MSGTDGIFSLAGGAGVSGVFIFNTYYYDDVPLYFSQFPYHRKVQFKCTPAPVSEFSFPKKTYDFLLSEKILIFRVWRHHLSS
jgi:hypothetical protein